MDAPMFFQADRVELTIEEARRIASMLRFPSHWEGSELRRTGMRLDARAQYAEDQNDTRQRIADSYPLDSTKRA